MMCACLSIILGIDQDKGFRLSMLSIGSSKRVAVSSSASGTGAAPQPVQGVHVGKKPSVDLQEYR